jgi:hypothetical protein
VAPTNHSPASAVAGRNLDVLPGRLEAGKSQLQGGNCRQNLEAIAAQLAGQPGGNAVAQRVAGGQRDDRWPASRAALIQPAPGRAPSMSFKVGAGGKVGRTSSSVRPAPITTSAVGQTLAGASESRPSRRRECRSRAGYQRISSSSTSTNELPLEIANEDGQVVVAGVTGFQAANRLAGQRPVEGYGQPERGQFFSGETGGFGGADFFDQIRRRADFLRADSASSRGRSRPSRRG